MKRLVAVCVAALGIAGFAAAQAGQPGPAPQDRPKPQTVAVSGTLAFIDGTAGLKADGTTYYVPGVMRLSGFIKDLSEGAQVKLEGYSYPLPKKEGYAVLLLTKLTINGRDYDLGKAGPFERRGMMGRGGMMRDWDGPGRGRGMWDRW